MEFSSKFEKESLAITYQRLVNQLELEILERSLRLGLDPEELDLDWEPSDLENTSETDLKKSLVAYKAVLEKKIKFKQ
jgi:hypothetical protein